MMNWLSRLVDSTTKVVVWFVLCINYYFVFRAFAGWESGLDGAAELLAVLFVSIDAVVAYSIWKSKNENMIKLSKPFGKEFQKEILKKSANIESEDYAE